MAARGSGAVVVEGAVVAVPAGGVALRFVEPGDEMRPVHGGETRFGFGEVLLHAGEDRVPDDEIDGQVGLFASCRVAGGAPEGFLHDAAQDRVVFRSEPILKWAIESLISLVCRLRISAPHVGQSSGVLTWMVSNIPMLVRFATRDLLRSRGKSLAKTE